MPYVLVKAVHVQLDKKNDVASVWVEDIQLNKFKVCLREMQNFDGQHKKISVVSNAFVHPARIN